MARWQALKRQGVGPEDTHVELLDGGSAALVGSDHLHLHDLDGVGTGTVASTHVTVCERVMNLLTNCRVVVGESSEEEAELWG